MAIKKSLFERYKSGIVVEYIDFDWDKGRFYKLDFAPASIAIIVPGSMVEEYKKLAQTKKSEYPPATEFVKETGMLERLRKSNVKIIDRRWNNLGDVLDFLEKSFYSASFQALESKDVRLKIEEIIPTDEAFAA
ncbi:hypothetical protein D4Q76_01190 [archaeon]|nr:MAG: hypothetical protein D4Q76_01190 [archaeon]